jgi:predicted amidohydrolase
MWPERPAVAVPGEEVDRLSEIARANGFHLVVGIVERVGTSLFCSALTIDDSGGLVGHRRKLMPTGSRSGKNAENAGSPRNGSRSWPASTALT